MLYKDLSSTYKALAALQSPYPILVILAKDLFFRDDCITRYVGVCKASGCRIIHTSFPSIFTYSEEILQPSALFPEPQLYCIRGGKVHQKEQDAFCSLQQSAAPECFFVIVDEEGEGEKISSYAQEKGAVYLIPSIKPWEKIPKIVQWIKAFCTKRSSAIQVEAAALLANSFLNDHRGLILELEKLILGSADPSMITEGDVYELSCCDVEPSIFQIVDGLLEKNPVMVANVLDSMLDMHEIGLLRFVKNQLEKIVTLLQKNEEGKTQAQRRQMQCARKLGLEQLFVWINACKMQEVDIRSGKKEASRLALLTFFVTIQIPSFVGYLNEKNKP